MTSPWRLLHLAAAGVDNKIVGCQFCFRYLVARLDSPSPKLMSRELLLTHLVNLNSAEHPRRSPALSWQKPCETNTKSVLVGNWTLPTHYIVVVHSGFVALT